MISNTVQVSHKSPISQEKLISLLTKYDKLILELFNDVSRYSSKIYMTRETIAKRVGCCEKTVSRVTSKLNKLGLIIKKRWFVGTMEKCSYKVVTKYLNIFEKKINKFLDAGSKFAIRILQSKPLQVENVPVVNSSLLEDLYKKFSLGLRETYNVERGEVGVVSDTNGNETKQFFKKISEREEEQDQRSQLEKMYDEMKDKMMNKDLNVLVTPAIAMATEILGLTKCGQCTLRTYSDEAIEYALERLSNAPHVNSEWDYVWQETKRYTHENRLEENFGRCINLKLGYAIPDTDRTYIAQRDKNFKKEKAAYNSKQVGYGGKGGNATQYPEEITSQAKKTFNEEEELRLLRHAIEKKVEKRPILEVMAFLHLLEKTEQGKNAFKVMGDSITVSPAFYRAIRDVSEVERERVFILHPYLRNSVVGVWPAFVSPKKTREENILASHNRARRYLSDQEYKACLIITPFKPFIEIKETIPMGQLNIAGSSSFKSMGAIAAELTGQGTDYLVKRTREILSEKPKNNIREDWDESDPNSLPF